VLAQKTRTNSGCAESHPHSVSPEGERAHFRAPEGENSHRRLYGGGGICVEHKAGVAVQDFYVFSQLRKGATLSLIPANLQRSCRPACMGKTSGAIQRQLSLKVGYQESCRESWQQTLRDRREAICYMRMGGWYAFSVATGRACRLQRLKGTIKGQMAMY
jgi:hypothetical protein